MRVPRIPPLLALMALGVSLPWAACSSSQRGDVDLPIAEIAGRKIYQDEFDPMLRRNLEGSLHNASDPVKSRLLDQFLDRVVLLEEAERRGVQVVESEVERFLGPSLGDEEPEDPGYREEVRKTLTVQKLLRQILAESGAVTAEEEERYFRAHPDAFHRPAVMVVRQILLDDPKEAASRREELAALPGSFREVAATISLSPDRGEPQRYAVDALPTPVAQALADLKPGEISPVIELTPDYLIFQVVSLQEERSVPLEEARPEIQAKLLEERSDGAVASLLTQLKEKWELRLYETNLSFRYVREDPA